MSKRKLKLIESKKISIKDLNNQIHKSGLMNFDVDAKFDYLTFDLKLDLNKKVISFFAANGVGKSSICKHLEYFLFHEKSTMADVLLYPHIRMDHERKNVVHTNFYGYGGEVGVGFLNDDKNIFLNLDNILSAKTEFILPQYAINTLRKYSFSNLFKKNTFRNTPLGLEIKSFNDFHNHKIEDGTGLYNVFSNLTEKFFYKKAFIRDETHMYPSDHMDNTLYMIASIIEIMAFLVEMNLEDFIDLLLNDKVFKIKNEENLKFDFKQTLSFIDLFSKNKKLLNFLLIVYQDHIPKILRNKLQEDIKDYNKNIQNTFNIALKNFQNYFPNKFLNFSLKERYNPCFDSIIFDLEIQNLRGDIFHLNNFLTNIASEGEKKLVNLFVLLLSIYHENENYYLILGDDFLTSFDNGNAINILRLLESLFKNKKSTFVNFTHDLELYRIFNNVFNPTYDDMLMVFKGKDNFSINFTKFPIKKDYHQYYMKTKKSKDAETNLIYLLSLLPHYRNMVEMIDGQKTKYLRATNFLHYKNDKSIGLLKIFNDFIFKDSAILNDPITKQSIIAHISNQKSYFNLLNNIFNRANSNNIDWNAFECRTFLAIYGRLLIEDWMWRFLKTGNKKFKLKKEDANQTYELLKETKNKIKVLGRENELEELISSFENLKSYLPDYIHSKHNELSYLININANGFLSAIDLVKKNMNKLI
jgi:energy-coupling factor transporter ATP-binding protein EcfA2